MSESKDYSINTKRTKLTTVTLSIRGDVSSTMTFTGAGDVKVKVQDIYESSEDEYSDDPEDAECSNFSTSEEDEAGTFSLGEEDTEDDDKSDADKVGLPPQSMTGRKPTLKKRRRIVVEDDDADETEDPDATQLVDTQENIETEVAPVSIALPPPISKDEIRKGMKGLQAPSPILSLLSSSSSSSTDDSDSDSSPAIIKPKANAK